MKLWVDDIRPAPDGYIHAKSVVEAKSKIIQSEALYKTGKNPETQIELIDIDHDSGDYFQLGGDYIELLNWLEETRRDYPIRIHSMNPVGIENMRRIIRRNGWREIK